MTKKEFENLSHRLVAPKDYVYIKNLYMASGNMDKVDFCIEMSKMCAYDAATDQIELRPCLKEIGRKVGALEAELSFLKKRRSEKCYEVAEFLIGKACAYEDSDFYEQAVKLIGKQEVVALKQSMHLPIWDEEREYILENLK